MLNFLVISMALIALGVSTAPIDSTCPNHCVGTGNYAHPTDKTKFVVCDYGEVLGCGKCDEGVFDESTNSCLVYINRYPKFESNKGEDTPPINEED